MTPLFEKLVGKTHLTAADAAYINVFRTELFGLPELKPGPTTCLKCSRTFDSYDVKNNKICPACREINSEIYQPDVVPLDGLKEVIDKL